MVPDTFSRERDYIPKHKKFTKNTKLAYQQNTYQPKANKSRKKYPSKEAPEKETP